MQILKLKNLRIVGLIRCFVFPCTADKLNCKINLLQRKKAKRLEDVDTKFIKIFNFIISLIRSKFLTYAQLIVLTLISSSGRNDSHCKKGKIAKATNYRLISLLSRFDKIFEKFLYKRLIWYIDKLV